MTDEERAAAQHLREQALALTDHPDKAVSILMTAAASILQVRFGAEQAIEHMTAALDVAGGDARRATEAGRPTPPKAGRTPTLKGLPARTTIEGGKGPEAR